MITKMKSRLNSEGGFTLIELLVVMIILGVLMAIAVPSYMSFRERAADTAAQANLKQAQPAAEVYAQDKTDGSGYVGMTVAGLLLINPGIVGVTVGPTLSATAYCLQAGAGTSIYNLVGPQGTITTGACV